MSLLLDGTPIAVKTTDEPSVIFGTGYVTGYLHCLEDFCEEMTEISVPVVRALRKLHAYTSGTAIRVRALKAYRTIL
ncbi:MAG: hypothetical protein KAV87_00460 [Desulfobacteraceae bacterium]|nr:hypothetical protein [Desulfobacteraceae bacterium]